MDSEDRKTYQPLAADHANQSLLITPRELAASLGVSERTVWRLRDAGKLPPPVKLGASVRWRRDEIEQWVKNGCPIQERRIDGFRSH